MDDLRHQLELLFNPNSPREASFSVDIEQSLPFVPPNNLTSPISAPPVDQNTALAPPPISFDDPLRSTMLNNQYPDAFAPTPIPFALENPHPHPPQQQQQQLAPLMGCFGLNRMSRMNQMLCMDLRNTYDFQHRSYLNPSGDPMGPNWEAINAYLSGQVLQQGSEEVRVFRCSVCGVEFPNAQAFGGHMSSHSKTRQRRSLVPTKAQFKRVGGSTTKTKSSVDMNKKKKKKKKMMMESNNKGKELSKE